MLLGVVSGSCSLHILGLDFVGLSGAAVSSSRSALLAFFYFGTCKHRTGYTSGMHNICTTLIRRYLARACRLPCCQQSGNKNARALSRQRSRTQPRRGLVQAQEHSMGLGERSGVLFVVVLVFFLSRRTQARPRFQPSFVWWIGRTI